MIKNRKEQQHETNCQRIDARRCFRLATTETPSQEKVEKFLKRKFCTFRMIVFRIVIVFHNTNIVNFTHLYAVCMQRNIFPCANVDEQLDGEVVAAPR